MVVLDPGFENGLFLFIFALVSLAEETLTEYEY